MANGSGRVAMRREVLDALAGHWPLQKAVAKECKRRGVGSAPEQYAALKRGEPVSAEFAGAVTACVIAGHRDEGRAWGYLTFLAMWEPVVTDEQSEWRDPERVQLGVFGLLFDVPHRHVADPAVELPQIARFLMASAGRAAALDGEPDDEGYLIRRAEAKLKRTVAEFERFLAGVHAVDRHAVMYTVQREDGEARRVGATVAFGLTRAAAERFLGGELADKDITPADVSPAADTVLVNITGRMPDALAIPDKEYSRAEVRTLLLQVAYFLRRTGVADQRVISFGGTPRVRDRLAALGFLDAGKRMPGFDVPVLQLHGAVWLYTTAAVLQLINKSNWD